MTFRVLTPPDWSDGNQILFDVFIRERYVPTSLADKLSVESNAKSGTWIGSFDGQDDLVGLVLLTEFGAEAARVAQPNGAEIRLLAVLPERRRSNIATGLISTAESLALEKGQTTMSLSTQETMRAARNLYRGLDYTEHADRSYTSIGKRFLVFEKRLVVTPTHD